MDTETVTARQEFEQAVRYLDQHMAEVVADYDGKYVAILHNQIQDCDTDGEALAQRMYERFGVRHLFMPYIGSSSRAPVRLRTPRRGR